VEVAVVQEQAVPETPGIVIGNTTPKYTAKNPAIRWLTERWVANLEKIFDQVGTDPHGAPKRALEVGCGEGVIADKLHHRFGDVVALDLPDSGLRSWWDQYPGPAYLHADAHHLPFDDDQFDLVIAVEVLEHLTDPLQGLGELARVSRRHLIVSVPREPIFRSCNLVAGRYVRDLGNTPGHLNHWSKRGFTKFIGAHADIRQVTSPFPWTTIWATLPG
jgi:2-polyprenyl-3-methyl-5-hydroxy-6-metoxy-1,4-benzoquinol methylase